MLLVDSAIYIDLLRAGRDPVAELQPWIETGQLLSCGIIQCEVLRGIRARGMLSRMKELFAIAADVAFTPELWSRIADLAWKLDRHGFVLPLTDVAIGTCALRAGARLVTTDPHFRHIPGLQVVEALPTGM